MQGTRLSIGFRTALAIFTIALFATSAWAATHETVVHSFNGGADGYWPTAGLIFDAQGNLYGTTVSGGTYDSGTVFELTPSGNGEWTEQVLYSFGSSETDGYGPSAGLIFDAHGNLYGTTPYGGTYLGGTVFELTPGEDGHWTEKILHNFGKGEDGREPAASLIFDAQGNLYGTTEYGGTHHGVDGTVFELTPHNSGDWTETVLHNFDNNGDGYYPHSSLIFDANGNLYGTTWSGGANANGTVFELTPHSDGDWTEHVRYSFCAQTNCTDGSGPQAGLIFDAHGNLYGTTDHGGTYLGGTVFELTPHNDGDWTETVLHGFGHGTDGDAPWAGLIFDSHGNLYSTTLDNGTRNLGTVFELTPHNDGDWTETVFRFNGTDGGPYPYAGLISDAHGNLYGTTKNGGIYGYGTVFEITF